jgi:hypothetical protein
MALIDTLTDRAWVEESATAEGMQREERSGPLPSAMYYIAQLAAHLSQALNPLSEGGRKSEPVSVERTTLEIGP